MDVIWVDGVPMTEEEKDLEDALEEELYWLETDEVETLSKNDCALLLRMMPQLKHSLLKNWESCNYLMKIM